MAHSGKCGTHGWRPPVELSHLGDLLCKSQHNQMTAISISQLELSIPLEDCSHCPKEWDRINGYAMLCFHQNYGFGILVRSITNWYQTHSMFLVQITERAICRDGNLDQSDNWHWGRKGYLYERPEKVLPQSVLQQTLNVEHSGVLRTQVYGLSWCVFLCPRAFGIWVGP